MARVRVAFDGRLEVGGAPLLMHNERLMDSLDPYKRWVAEMTSKTKRTEQQEEELARREFLGGGYWLIDEGPNTWPEIPVIPGWNIVSCLWEGAKLRKLGQKVKQGVLPTEEHVLLQYNGPASTEALWKAGTFHDRKGIKISGRRMPRTRACFTDWKIETDLEVNLSVLDVEKVNLIAVDAGQLIGLGDNRPRFGRFLGHAAIIGDPLAFTAADALMLRRGQQADASGRKAIETIDRRHAELNPTGKERKERVRKELGKS